MQLTRGGGSGALRALQQLLDETISAGHTREAFAVSNLKDISNLKWVQNKETHLVRVLETKTYKEWIREFLED